MWKPLTGEPYAGKPHVRLGGRGGAEPSLPLSSPCRLQSFLDDAEEGAARAGVAALLGAGGGDFGD